MRGRTGRIARGLAMAAALACATGAQAQVKPGSDQGLGLTGGDIPPLLKAVQTDPYRMPAQPGCPGVHDEIAALDNLLGPDVDTPVKDKTTGGDVIRGLVPYGGVVRFLTGAGSKDKALRQAVLAGYARRGFLRGLGAGLSCAPPTAEAAPNPTPGPTPNPTPPR